MEDSHIDRVVLGTGFWILDNWLLGKGGVGRIGSLKILASPKLAWSLFGEKLSLFWGKVITFLGKSYHVLGKCYHFWGSIITLG